MVLLSIETSCDETAAAVVLDGCRILSSVVSSQIPIHAEYGGVVPEIASRKHLEMISPVIGQALDEARVGFSELDGVVVTRGPGLSGALLVGMSAAKSIAAALSIPLIGVHHIEGHIFAAFLENQIEFPFVALVVSGGHTHIYWVEGFGRYTTLGRTIDDAVGEAFDKSAKIMGIEYPGGAVIDRLAQQGSASAFSLPRPLLHDGSLNFSFSGLKTAMLQQVRRSPVVIPSDAANDLCASFQQSVCDVLAAKTATAIGQRKAQRLVLAGGVACNSGLRARMTRLASELGVSLYMPSPSLCGDNAAMLAVSGYNYLSRGMSSSMDMDVTATWELDRVGDFYHGK